MLIRTPGDWKVILSRLRISLPKITNWEELGYLPMPPHWEGMQHNFGLNAGNPSADTQIKYKNCPSPRNGRLRWPRWRTPIPLSSSIRECSLWQLFPGARYLKLLFFSAAPLSADRVTNESRSAWKQRCKWEMTCIHRQGCEELVKYATLSAIIYGEVWSVGVIKVSLLVNWTKVL